jgi:hypothetical protein
MTEEEMNKVVINEGWFYGLEKINQRQTMSAQESAQIKSNMFAHILKKVVEAKNEIAKLEAAVKRMEAAARSGAAVKPGEGKNFNSSDIQQIRNQMKAFHGWTISLLESDISLLAAVETPEAAGKAIGGLKNAFAVLWSTRLQYGFRMMHRMPSAFEGVIRY